MSHTSHWISSLNISKNSFLQYRFSNSNRILARLLSLVHRRYRIKLVRAHPLGFPSIAERRFVTVQFRELDFRECHVSRAHSRLTRSLYLVSKRNFSKHSPRRARYGHGRTRAHDVSHARLHAQEVGQLYWNCFHGKMVWTCSNRRRDSTDVSRCDAKLSRERIYAPRYTSIASITRRCHSPDMLRIGSFYNMVFFASGTDFILYTLQ